MSDVVAMRDVIVIGGGCYGTFYAGQLAKAKAKGKARFRRVVVVDRAATCRARGELGEAPDRAFAVEEWGAFFDRFLAGVHTPPPGEPEDYIVPSPLMPHLMFEWVLRRARRRGRGAGRGARGDDLELPRGLELAQNRGGEGDFRHQTSDIRHQTSDVRHQC